MTPFARFNGDAFKFAILRPYNRMSFGVHLAVMHADHTMSEAQNLTLRHFTKEEEGGAWGEPLLALTYEELQDLMNELIRAGIRPTVRMEPDSIMAQHLADMRAIAFHKLGVQKP